MSSKISLTPSGAIPNMSQASAIPVPGPPPLPGSVPPPPTLTAPPPPPPVGFTMKAKVTAETASAQKKPSGPPKPVFGNKSAGFSVSGSLS